MAYDYVWCMSMLFIKNYFTKIKISIFEEGIYITIWNMIYKMICMYFTDDRMISNVVQEEPPYRVWWPYSAFSPPGSSFCKNNRYLVACTQSRVNLYIFNGFGTLPTSKFNFYIQSLPFNIHCTTCLSLPTPTMIYMQWLFYLKSGHITSFPTILNIPTRI